MCGLCTGATSKAVPCICIDLALTCSKAVCSLLECVCKASSCAAETSDLLKDWSSMLLCDSTAPLQTCPLSMSNTHACRQGANGKLSSASHLPGQLRLLESALFSAGQSKATLHTDIHSISCTSQDLAVTLVIRHKDAAAKSRHTSCFMTNKYKANMANNATWTDQHAQEDRPCTENERSSMWKVGAHACTTYFSSDMPKD